MRDIYALRGSIYVPLRVILSSEKSHLLLCLYGQIPGTFCLCKCAFSEGEAGKTHESCSTEQGLGE